MAQRVFLGWDRPFLLEAAAWLLERRDMLPGMLVVVPTSASGRRLREALAEAGGAVLAPRIATPGSFMKGDHLPANVAPEWAEHVAWAEVLEAVQDWSAYSGLFPESPQADADWANGLAAEMVQLRHALQENALSLGSAARLLRDTVEADRWDALGKLEKLVERKLESWGYQSRTRVLAAGMLIPPDVSHIVLAGVAEMPPLVEQTLLAWEKRSCDENCGGALRAPSANGKSELGGHRPPPQCLTVLLGSPEIEADGFSSLGQPLAVWCAREMPWPEGAMGSVRLAADPRQQALEALRIIGCEKSPSNEVAVGAADVEVGEELAREFTRHGWPAFHPAAPQPNTGLARWFKVWCEWLADPTLAVMQDLLTLPETAVLVGGRRAQKAQRLSELRDGWMVIRTEDLQRRLDSHAFRSDHEKSSAQEVLDAAILLENPRARFLHDDFTAATGGLLDKLAAAGPATAEMAATFGEWLAQAAPVIGRTRRNPRYWIDLMLDDAPLPAPLPPPGRVIDVQGWLEMYFEPGRHLVLCGMNEGKVPARSGGEPWLGEAARLKLGLLTDVARAARDAFLFHAMVMARRDGGRVDLLCGKSGTGGDTLLPSRLLLAAEQSALPLRVKTLFREIEPPEAGLRWHADWQWSVRLLDPPNRISVTSLPAYLACPLRYYLKYVVGMQIPEPARVEWNARDFGTVAHEVLERWGADPEAREFEKAEALVEWFSAELDRVVAGWFGKRVPMAVRIQTESLRQRLAWMARAQACERAAGWQVVDVERKVEIAAGEALLVARIDRIDRHRETGELRVIDYKTGKVDGVEKAHRSKVIATTKLPAHLTDSPAVYQRAESGKVVPYRWVNLQLPLYALALVLRNESLPRPCYFTLGSTEADVGLQEWADFTPDDLAAARACAEWVANNISNRIFGPPADKVTYDDYSTLAAGRPLSEAMVLAPLQ